MIERDKYVKFRTIVQDGSKGPPDVPPVVSDLPAITTEDDALLCAEDGAVLLWEVGTIRKTRV